MKTRMIAKAGKRIITIMLSLTMVAGVFVGVKLDVKAAGTHYFHSNDTKYTTEITDYSNSVSGSDSFQIYGDMNDICAYFKIFSAGADIEKDTPVATDMKYHSAGEFYIGCNLSEVNGVNSNLIYSLKVKKEWDVNRYKWTFYLIENEIKEINNVNISITKPVAGSWLATYCSTNSTEFSKTYANVTWYKENEIADTQAKIDYSTIYKMETKLDAAVGYKFAENVSVTVNGVSAAGVVSSDKRSCTVTYTFDKTDPKPADKTYEISEGNNSKHIKGSDENLVIRSSASSLSFSRIKVNGVLVPTENYDVIEYIAETIIVFKADYLNTLPKGRYSIEIIWNEDSKDISANGFFYIIDENEKTVDNFNDATAEDTVAKVEHVCNFEWIITIDPTTGADGLEEYKCAGCGLVKESHPIPASVAAVKDFYGNIKDAPENGSITYDSGKLYTISDYLLKKMSERSDVSVTVNFEYQNAKYELTFPAGTDFTPVLTDEDTMYGYFGVAAKLGLTVVAK